MAKNNSCYHSQIKKLIAILPITVLAVLILNGCTADQTYESAEEGLPENEYSLSSVHQVNGRQGVCVAGDTYWVSGSTTLTKYDKDWNVIAENADPFKGYDIEVNHIGDIDV